MGLLYLVKVAIDYNGILYEVLDTDDLTIETVSREVITNALLSGVVFENIPREEALKHQRIKLILSDNIKLRDKSSSYIGTESVSAIYCKIYNQLLDLSVNSFKDEESDVFVKSISSKDCMKLFIYIQGRLYTVELRVNWSLLMYDTSMRVRVNNEVSFDVDDTKSFSGIYFGYVKRIGYWKLSMKDATLFFDNGVVSLKKRGSVFKDVLMVEKTATMDSVKRSIMFG